MVLDQSGGRSQIAQAYGQGAGTAPGFGMTRGRIERAALRALQVGCIVVLCGFAIEAGYRLWVGIPLSGNLVVENDGTDRIATFRKSANPLLVYEPIPGARSRYTGVPNVINSHGLRDREVPIAKPPGTRRIAVLGDSLIYGYGLPLEDTFAKQLETALRAQESGTWKVLGFGVPGYSTQQETEMYRSRAQRFDPDLVIVGYNLNDEQQQSLEIELFDRAYFSIFANFYFVDFLEAAAWQPLRGRFGSERYAYQLETDVREDFARLRSAVGPELPVLVVVFPFLVDFADYPYEPRHQRIARAAAANDLLLLDLLEAFRPYEAAALRVFDDDREHPNAEGQRLAARATLQFLQLRGLLAVNARRATATEE